MRLLNETIRSHRLSLHGELLDLWQGLLMYPSVARDVSQDETRGDSCDCEHQKHASDKGRLTHDSHDGHRRARFNDALLAQAPELRAHLRCGSEALPAVLFEGLTDDAVAFGGDFWLHTGKRRGRCVQDGI